MTNTIKFVGNLFARVLLVLGYVALQGRERDDDRRSRTVATLDWLSRRSTRAVSGAVSAPTAPVARAA